MSNKHFSHHEEKWQALKDHRKTLEGKRIEDLFTTDSNRFENFHLKLDGVLFDYSKHAITLETLALLEALGEAADIQDHYKAMLSGQPVNMTENRAALHTALRTPISNDVIIDGENINAFVATMQKQIEKISTDMRDNSGVTDIIHIGVGGSHLAVQMICEALGADHSGPHIHFLANIDGQTITTLLKKLNPATTRIIIASKTFTTSETMACAAIVKEWQGNAKTMIAITAESEKASAFGIADHNILPMRGWIGGRYSVWSSIGLPVAIAFGYDVFSEILSGASLVDHHIMTAPLSQNIPFVMAALGIWYRNMMDYRALAILPYADSLQSFAAYVQQIDMESNGKASLRHQTAPMIFGGSGTGVQHSFMQALHQGTDIIPCDFIVLSTNKNASKALQQTLAANALAQSQALMRGDPNHEEPHKHFAGNRPSSTFLIESLTPKTLGMIMALYEHKTIIQGVMWGVNSFDQWGVELGKKLAIDITRDLHTQTVSSTHDASTAALIRGILKAG
jgi:glucose-6-phosphate isomerase